MLLAEVRLDNPPSKPLRNRLFVEVGEWDLIIDPIEFTAPGRFFALVGYLNPDAPCVTQHARLEIRRGGLIIGTVVVLGF